MSDDQSLETEATELLRTLIRNACVNDGTPASGHEDRNCDAIEAYFAGSGLRCERYSAGPGRISLITRIEGSDKKAPTLLLMGHTDVVPANASGWERDPFGGEVVDGVVWGRGATDMLHITSTMAVAMRRLVKSGFTPRGTLIYLAVADEEAGGTYGAKLSRRREVRRGQGGLRDHGERRRADPHQVGREAAGDGGREGRSTGGGSWSGARRGMARCRSAPTTRW